MFFSSLVLNATSYAFVITSYIFNPQNPWAPVHVVRNCLLKLLLKYRGCITNPKSKLAMAYFGAIQFLATKPYVEADALQWALPSLPVPSLHTTFKDFVYSVKPLLTEEEFADLEEQVDYFLTKGNAKKLQLYLHAMDWDPRRECWLNEMWLRVAYLMARTPLPLASSFYSTDYKPQYQNTHYTTNQAERASTILASQLSLLGLVRNNTMPPYLGAGVIPLCMAKFKDIFGTTRIPQQDEDVLHHHYESNHVAVLHKGNIFTFDCFHKDGTVLAVSELQNQFESILEYDWGSISNNCENLSACSSLPRNGWADVRSKMMQNTKNKETFNKIESALICICLDEESPTDVTNYTNLIFHNNGFNRWFDKSCNSVVFKNGRHGNCYEHSFADGSVAGQFTELYYLQESFYYPKHLEMIAKMAENKGKKLYQRYDTLPPRTPEIERKLAKVELMQFEDNYDLTKRRIPHAVEQMKEQLEDISMKVFFFREFGSSNIKKNKFSPDAFMQMAIQIAYYRMFNECVLTYESVTTRTFRLGRTETNRSFSCEAKEFLFDFLSDDNKSKKNDALMKKLYSFSKAHSTRIRNASAGQGTDRHVMALRVLANATNNPVELFEHKAFHLPWKISTTSFTLTLNHENSFLATKEADQWTTIGGGFCQFEEDGVGVAYFYYEDAICLHLNARKGPKNTNPDQITDDFNQHLTVALSDLLNFLVVNKA